MSSVEQYSPLPETVPEAMKDVAIRTGMFLIGIALSNQVDPDRPVGINIATVTAGFALAVSGVFRPMIRDVYHDFKVGQNQKKEMIIFNQQNTNGGGI